jgi:RNA polymerase sigma-70 factor (ECF subfamily)
VDQSCNENTLVAQGLKRHDPELLDQLIVQYQHRLLRYLLYLTGNRETAEDIFQETWMRVLKRGDQFNGKSRFDTWLFTIARVAAEGPSPFEMYQTNENGQRVAEALLTLEPLHREVLVLRFHEELSLEEIAQVTHSPLSTVKSRLYRGLSALKPRICAAEAASSAEGQNR